MTPSCDPYHDFSHTVWFIQYWPWYVWSQAQLGFIVSIRVGPTLWDPMAVAHSHTGRIWIWDFSGRWTPSSVREFVVRHRLYLKHVSNEILILLSWQLVLEHYELWACGAPLVLGFNVREFKCVQIMEMSSVKMQVDHSHRSHSNLSIREIWNLLKACFLHRLFRPSVNT